jgi:hypothetical protein
VRPNLSHSVTRPVPSSLLPNPTSILESTLYPSVPPLVLPPSLLRPASPFSQECFNYHFFIENVETLANDAGLPFPYAEGIRKTSSLGRWKQDELDRGRLSNRELARRARDIEDQLNIAHDALNDQMVKYGIQSRREEEAMLEFLDFAAEDMSQAGTFNYLN